MWRSSWTPATRRNGDSRTPRGRQITVRLALLAALAITEGFLAWFMFWRHGSTSVTVTSFTGGLTHTRRLLQANQSIYEENPGPVSVILVVVVAAGLVAACSVLWRISHRVTGLGVAGTSAAVVVGALAILGMLSVGPFISPVAVLVLLLALPLDKLADSALSADPEADLD